MNQKAIEQLSELIDQRVSEAVRAKRGGRMTEGHLLDALNAWRKVQDGLIDAANAVALAQGAMSRVALDVKNREPGSERPIKQLLGDGKKIQGLINNAISSNNRLMGQIGRVGARDPYRTS